MELTPHQTAAVDTVLRGFANGQPQQVLAGAAGTGKTTCMRTVADLWPGSEVILAAPTNKAALRLRDLSGRNACTIHSLAYQRPVIEEETGELRGFDSREDGTLNVAGDALVISDEASMLGRRLYDALRAALPPGPRLLFVGDWAQLPPVMQRPAVDLEHPDAMLTEVHRQVAGSPILIRATEIRTRRVPLTAALVRSWGVQVSHVEPLAVGVALAQGDWEIAITYTNRARWQINEAARAALGKPPLAEGPKVGDKVIAVTTNPHLGIPNGERGLVRHVQAGRPIEEEATWFVVVDWGASLGEVGVVVPRSSWCPQGSKPWDPELSTRPVSRLFVKAPVGATLKLLGLQAAWAMTTHKMQGDQARNGIIVLESMAKRDRHAWKLGYTQLTRFQQDVAFVTIPTAGSSRRRGSAVRRFL